MKRQKAKGKRQKAKVPGRSAGVRLAGFALHHCVSASWRGGFHNRLLDKASITLAAGRRAIIFAFCLLPFAFCLPLSAGAAAPQKVVDQIIAQVNEDIIARSDLLWSLAMDGKAPNPAEGVSSDLLRQKLDVLIDQRLIAQEARRTPTAEITQDDIHKRRDELIREFRSEPTFWQRVEAVGLTRDRVDELIRERILIERFVDFRFRSFVLVTEPEIQRYYDETFAPRFRERGQIVPSLDDKLPKKDPADKETTVREAITEILKQEKINQEIDRFLNATRQRADITILNEP